MSLATFRIGDKSGKPVACLSCLTDKEGKPLAPIKPPRYVKGKLVRQSKTPAPYRESSLGWRHRAQTQAVFYVIWLAKRDGIALPEIGQMRCDWTTVQGEPRIRSVEWRAQGATVYEYVLPNWDFVPVMTEDSTLPLAA